MSSRDEYVKKMKHRLDALNDEIDLLESKFDSAKADAKVEYQEKLTEAKALRRDAEAKITEIQGAAEDAWQAMQDEAEHTWKALTNSVAYFKSHFK